MDHIAVRCDRPHQTQVGEDVHHAGVDGKHVGGETSYAAPSGERGEVLDHQRADAVRLLGVRYDQRDLGGAALVEDHVVGGTEQQFAAERPDGDMPGVLGRHQARDEVVGQVR
jgi:hypothetical protein